MASIRTPEGISVTAGHISFALAHQTRYWCAYSMPKRPGELLFEEILYEYLNTCSLPRQARVWPHALRKNAYAPAT